VQGRQRLGWRTLLDLSSRESKSSRRSQVGQGLRPLPIDFGSFAGEGLRVKNALHFNLLRKLSLSQSSNVVLYCP